MIHPSAQSADRAVDGSAELISQIGTMVVDSVDGPWIALTYSASMLSMYAEDGVQVQRPDGTSESAFGPPRVIKLLKELRKVMYQPGGGTWLSAEWSITDDGESRSAKAKFNYDAEPHWDSDIDPGLYGLDLERFPRDEGAVPGWLRTKITEAEARAPR